MPTEIERKFLVSNENFKEESFKELRIIQGYLCSIPERTVRVRVTGEQGFIAVKGIINKSDLSRFEWEKEISVPEANELLKICEPGLIDKIRYHVQSGQHIFEVDEFYGENKGLTIAEIELKSEDEKFVKPAWLDVEVTGDVRYFNSTLKQHPYSTWKND